MADVNSMIEQVRSSGLPQKVKDKLIKRVVRGGPEFDVLQEINLEKLQMQKGRPPSTIVQLAFLVGLFLIGAYAYNVIIGILERPPAPEPVKEYRAPSPTPRPRREDDEGGAHVWAKDFVRERLRSPSTAKFASVLNANFTDLGNRKWRVVSYVDAQNAFGTEVRTYFDAVVRYVGNDQWELISLNTNQ